MDEKTVSGINVKKGIDIGGVKCAPQFLRAQFLRFTATGLWYR